MRSAGGTAYLTGRMLSVKWDIYPEWLLKEVPLPGIRGRLESELGEKGGGCWGRVDADCEECEDCAGGGAGLGAGTEGGGARAVCGRVSGVGLAEGRSGSRLPGITVPVEVTLRKACGTWSRLCLRASAVASSSLHWWVSMRVATCTKSMLELKKSTSPRGTG